MPPQDFPAVGLCRFSFVGRGDWRGYHRVRPSYASEEEFRVDKAKELYNPERMKKRFFTLERFLLPSMDAQTDKNFILLILTSDLMPEKYKAQLAEITKDRKYVKLIFSEENNVNSAFFPELNKIREQYGHRIPQFRIDDDDALCSTYVSLVRQATIRHQDLRHFSFSFPEGLVVTADRDDNSCFYKYRAPFIGAGVSVVTPNPRQTIYSFGHFALGQRFPAFMQNGTFGFLITRTGGHDCAKLPARGAGKFTLISEEEFLGGVEKNFPSLSFADIVSLRNHEHPEIE